MCKTTKRLLLFLFVCLLWLASGSGTRAEEMYQISESELTALETNLDELEKSNANKQQLLTEQMEQLETAQKELTASKSLNEATKRSLERANQSLQELEDEAKEKIEVKTQQRNLWIVISGGLLYALSKK
nr:MAG TPA: SECRETED 45 KDA PROTEIN CYCLE, PEPTIDOGLYCAN, CHAP, CELL [Caudoviricetes sp.]